MWYGRLEMPIYRSPEERASETVTVRLTVREKALLEHVARLEGKTLTDLLRGLVAQRAESLQIGDIPPISAKRRPGRPKKHSSAQSATGNRPFAEPVPSPETLATREVAQRRAAAPPDHQRALAASNPVAHLLTNDADVSGRAATFHDLIVRFHKSFAHRAEGTRKELEDTIEFVCLGGDAAMIPPDTPLATITSERLRDLRRIIQGSDLRFAKKNLHLTYLRMMLHFGLKDPDIDLHVNPSGELEPLSITESNEGWRFFSGR